MCCSVDGEFRGGAHVEEQQDGGSGLHVQTLHPRQQRTEDDVRVYQRLSQGAGQGARHRGGQRGRQERHHICTGTFIQRHHLIICTGMFIQRHLREQGKALVIEEGSEGAKNAITFVQVRSYNAYLREQGKALVIEEGSEGAKNAITFVQVCSYNAISGSRARRLS